jgi:cobalamin biosynthesis Mg chelatase CobN
MRVKLGIWAGGDPDNAEGTIEWAGGETDYDGVPYTMTVQKIKIENLNPAESYTYSDDSGSYKSIKFDKKDNGGSSDDDEDEDDKDEESSTASESASETASSTATETTMQTATKTDSDSETATASSDEASETDFKNNKAAESTGASSTATETSASASATETNSAAGNWPKMWLGLAAICAAMVMM